MSNSGLYGNVSNVTVSTKNLTTLYNATTGTAVVANVPDKNFTTLYASSQSDIKPSRPYGNANVEAFLNTGTDGSNTVQNINMSGALTVGGRSDLGPIGNVHIDGGSPGYTILTDGYGNLIWGQATQESNGAPYIHFDVTSTANNQTFTNGNLVIYQDENYFSLFKNGVNIEPFYYEKTGNTTVQVNIPLTTGDTIDILPSTSSASGASGTPGGIAGMVQFNTGYGFGGSSGFMYDTTNTQAIINNIAVPEVIEFSEVANIRIPGGVSNQVLSTDGASNLSWITIPGAGPATELIANIANVHIYDGSAGQLLMTDGAGNLTWSTVSGSPGGSNTQLQFNNNNNFGGIPDVTWNGTSLSLGNIGNVKLNGGTAGQAVSTDGNGNLSFTSVVSSAGGANTYIQYNNNAAFAGDSSFTFNNTTQTVTVANLTSTGTLTTSGNLVVQRAFEPFTSNGTGATGTIDFDVINQSIYYVTASATSNFVLNFRGNSTVTLNSLLPTNDTVTVVFLNTVGATPYVVDSVTIDGVATSVKYVNGNAPNLVSHLPNAKHSYTYTIMKTASSTYTVLGSLTEYQ